MSREQRRPAPPQRDATDASREAALQADCEPGLLEWIEIAVRDLATMAGTSGTAPDPAGAPPAAPAPADPPDGPDAPHASIPDPLYDHGFALGEALGRRFRARCGRDVGPQGLALLVERLAGPAPANRSAHVARRALLDGLCWDLENALCDRPAAALVTAPDA